MKALKIITIVLLVIASLCFFAGLQTSKDAAQKRATDTDKIKVEIVDKECWYEPDSSGYSNGCYYVKLTYEVKNKTKVDWSYLQVTTEVTDKSGKSLGTLTASLGSGNSSAKFKVGKSTKIDVTFDSKNPDDFFIALLEKELSEFTLESRVTSGNYIKD